MTKARDLANAGTALTSVSATELGYVDGVTSAIQTQIDSKEPTLPSQTGNSGKYLTTNGSTKSWGTVSQYSLPSQTGNSGKFLTTNGTSESWGTVNQPTTFTQRIPGDGQTIYTVGYNGSNLYVAAGSAGRLYTSPDGTTWTSRTSGFGTDVITKVAYGNGLWVAVGGAGKITTSTDGTTWTARTANMSTNQINDVVYANGIWVAVGAGGGTTNTGGITYSTDGITWTRKSQSITVGATYQCVTWNGTNWFVGSNLNSNNYLYASTPSGTWTSNVTGGSTITWCFYDGTRTIMGMSSQFNFTTSTTFATWSNINGVGQHDGSKYRTYLYGTLLYAATPSLITWFDLSTLTQNVDTAWYASGYKNMLNPLAVGSNSNPSINGANGTIFVNSSGMILGSDSGSVFTSF